MRKGIKHFAKLLTLAALLAGTARAGDTVYYIHTDALGSPVAVTDANRNVVERTQYAPYGQVLNRPEHDGPGYTGHEEDPQTGLTNLQARYDDKVIGRMISPDPVDVDPNTGANFNRYAYANDNPYRFTDPDGRYSCSGGKTDCAQIEQFDKNLVKATNNLSHNSEGYKALSAVVKFLGKPGEKNGVTIEASHSGDLGKASTKDGQTTIHVNLSLEAKVAHEQGSSFKSEGTATLAHEGQHGIDEQAHGMPTTRDSLYTYEMSAARTEAFSWQGMGQNSSWGTWTQSGGLNENAIQGEAHSSVVQACSQVACQ